jgi:hypothetical protein
MIFYEPTDLTEQWRRAKLREDPLHKSVLYYHKHQENKEYTSSTDSMELLYDLVCLLYHDHCEGLSFDVPFGN